MQCTGSDDCRRSTENVRRIVTECLISQHPDTATRPRGSPIQLQVLSSRLILSIRKSLLQFMGKLRELIEVIKFGAMGINAT